jgi:hypothetical protein
MTSKTDASQRNNSVRQSSLIMSRFDFRETQKESVNTSPDFNPEKKATRPA